MSIPEHNTMYKATYAEYKKYRKHIMGVFFIEVPMSICETFVKNRLLSSSPFASKVV